MCDTKLTTPHQPLSSWDRAIARALASALVKEVQAARTLPHNLVERAIQALKRKPEAA